MAKDTKTADPLDNSEKVRRVIALMDGGMSERGACAEVNIPRSTFRTTAIRVLSGDQYAGALESLAQDQVEKLESAIEDMRSGRIDHNMARVEIDARKWFASKFLPKRYGDKIDVNANHSGEIKIVIGGDV